MNFYEGTVASVYYNSRGGDLHAELKDENAQKEKIEEALKKLTDVSHKLAEAVYNKEQGGQANGANEAKKKDDDDIIDAEVE